mmetsp:Transcript_11056/g.16399  ORF Transcript_11056/g.16399 Transcript_11056/m.16399 type:complete len:196 (+) Transcript_11056:163-750(+)
MVDSRSHPSLRSDTTCACVFCILFVIITADPTTFYTIVWPWLPFEVWRWRLQFLQRGEKLVADATAATDGKEQSKDSDTSSPRTISLQMLIDEICKRIQTRYVITSIMAGIGVKFIAYQKPKVVGQMFDGVVVVQPNVTMETTFWPYLYFRLSTSFWCRQETTVLHRFRACSRTDMLANVLDQELDYLYTRIDIP